ncbi:MAG: Uncharacterized MFS-type transporter [uncultured Paraburkholderia sp.]|nr:MAG: Uncharacterized MFS-type transporter [uncultured Paraburkholderia sp.]CAH2802874.1 MAG: Uncharacterized MFS-type transporter [uncultured Paraburkholderia sp.]CAH2939875.1 MAG: Uncharacterized MFS-type transporter [uncultured Paraburkholderia sp.]
MRTIDNMIGDRSGAGVSGPVTRGSIIARLERLPKNAMQVRARILIGLATFFDGFDVIAIAATLPVLIAKWHLTPWEIGFLIGSGSVGQLIGAFVFPVGLLASNALGAWIVPRFGWQAMYFIGGMPLILFFLLRKLVPESPRWLAERERMADADAAVHAFERAAKGPLPPVTQAAEFEAMANRHPKRRMSDLFGAAYLKRTLAVAMLWITCGFIQSGLSTWLLTIYRTVYHAPLQLALNLAVAASVLGVVGSLTCALLVDKVGRKPIINLSFVACALSLLFAGVFHDSSVYVVAACCALSLGFLACGFITAYVYTPELYPTSIRAMGCGVGGAWLKVAAIFAPAIVSKTMIGGNLQFAFYILAAVAVHFLGIETKGKVLEQLEA